MEPDMRRVATSGRGGPGGGRDPASDPATDDEVCRVLDELARADPQARRRIVSRLVSDATHLAAALRYSVALQSYYAALLNAHDGGARMQFRDAVAWLDWLAAQGRIPPGVRA
jgi:hypothetical protein